MVYRGHERKVLVAFFLNKVRPVTVTVFISVSVCFSPNSGGRDDEIQTTHIISSDCEASQPQTDGNYPTDEIVQEAPESQRCSTEPPSKDKESHISAPVETEPHNHCTAPTGPPPSTPQQQHCSTVSAGASTMQNNSTLDSESVVLSNQELCQASPSASDKHSQPGPLTEQTPHLSQVAALSSTVAQTQSQTSREMRLTSAEVVPSSPPREPHPETPKSVASNPNLTSAPSSPCPATSPPPQALTNSTEGSPVADVPVPGFATLGRRLMLNGSDTQHTNHHYPGMEHNVADANRRPCSSAQTAQHHPSSCCNYSIISIPLPHPQPPLPEKRHVPSQPSTSTDGVGTLRSAVGPMHPSTSSQHQHHVTFSPTVGEIAATADQNGEASVETENVNRVSVKFVQDSSRFWYKPGITREQGRSDHSLISFEALFPISPK